MDMSISEVDSIVYNHQFTTLFDAVNGEDNRAILSLIKDGHDPNELNSEGWTVLHCAVFKGHYDSVQVLLLNGGDVSVPTKSGWFAIHIAAFNGKANLIDLIVKAQSDPDLKTVAGETPLYWAVDRGHRDVVLQLITSGCDVNTRNGADHRTALHHAAYTGKVEIAKILIQSNADLLLKTDDNKGWCALSIAAHEGHLEIIKLLMLNMIDLNVRCKSGRTPMYWAAKNNRIDSVHALLTPGFNSETDDVRPIHKIKCIPSDVNAVDNYGWSPLHSAVFNDNVDVVKELLSNGGKIDDLTNNSIKWGAIHIAACYELEEMLGFLLANKADVNLKTACLNTALHYAVHKNNLKIIQMLFEAGANPHSKNSMNKSPFSVAKSRGLKSIETLLKTQTLIKK